MNKQRMKDYGEEIWEAKIKAQGEAGVIFGSSFSVKEVEAETKSFMENMDKKVFPLRRGARVLDLGVGPMARFSVAFAKRGYDVTGADVSETTLKLAKVYAEKAGVKIKLIKEDITTADKIGKKFDMVFCRATFYHVPPYLTGVSLMKIKNILKPRGVFVVEFGIAKEGDFLGQLRHPFYWVGHYLKNLFGRGFKVNISRFTRKEIEELLEKSGLAIKGMVDATTYIVQAGKK